jgi:hypothetical protein
MSTSRFGRIALARLLVGAVLFGVPIEHAQAQPGFVPRVPPPPPPVFNPSPPNTTVPQPSYQPISPTTPSTVPEDEVTPPANEESTTDQTERGASVAKRRSVHHHRGRPTRPVASSYYPLPFGRYGCVWQRAWDGYWYRTSPCSW